MDYLLRTTTVFAMDSALQAAGLLFEAEIADGETALVPISGVSIDRIGPIPALLDPEGEVIRPTDSRYHANLRVTFDLTQEQVAELPTFSPEPSVPYRVFI